MMKPMFECGNLDGDGGGGETNGNNGEQLLHDIEEISKALYLHNTPFKASFSSDQNRSKSAGKARVSKRQVDSTQRFLREDPLPRDKKFLSSAWIWKKPLKALAHVGHQKFNCCFNLHVHSIEGLPLNFNGISLSVNWKRKSSILRTRPKRVLQGAVEFNETLTHRCSIYGGRTGSGHALKYESRRFLIYASIVGAPEHDLGDHHVDVTRILPLTLEELLGDKRSGAWSTNFRLAGKALGASLNVSFSYQVMKDELIGLGDNNLNDHIHNLTNLNVMGCSPSNREVKLLQGGSFPHDVYNRSVLPSHSNGDMLPHEALLKSGFSISKSMTILYQKLDEGNFHTSESEDSEHLAPLKSQILLKPDSPRESNLDDSDDTEFSITEQGIETLEEDSLKLDQTGVQTFDMSTVEIIDVDEILKDDDIFVEKNPSFDSMDAICSSYVNGAIADDSKHICMKIVDTVPETSDSFGKEHYLSIKSNYKSHKMAKKSHSLDDIIESVAGDFLNMLAMDNGSFGSGCGGDPQSPREQLLRQFEKEGLASGDFTFDFDANEEELGTDTLEHGFEDCAEDSDLSSIIQAAEEEYAREQQSIMQRRKAKLLEDLETDSLMQQWGLNERDFENSPRTWSGGFGSPIELCDNEPSMLPSIGQGLGSFVQITSGGFLRSMRPSLFANAKNCGNLIIQASNPVVLPAKMGNDTLEILLHVASSGVEDLCDHIYKLMPLKDITGKSIKHILRDHRTPKGSLQRQGSWQDLFEEFPQGYLTDESMGLDFVPLEAIAPMTIDKIEALLIEGLRIQYDMSSEQAPSYMHSQHTNMPDFGDRRANLRRFPTLEKVTKLQLEDSGEIYNDVDGLMSLSLTLDQWLRLDSGIIDADKNLGKMLKILKAHHCKITEIDDDRLKNAVDEVKTCGEKHGLLGNHITVAFMIQLRDPLRNYEPVGVPMLVLTQVERADTHSMQQDHSNFLARQEKGMEDDETSRFGFRIKEIDLAGIITKAGKTQLWGTAAQHQSGYRWLLASGVGSTVKHASSKLKAIVRSSPLITNKLLNQDVLWSISYADYNMRTNGKELAAENGHIRNPDVLFPS